MDHRGHDGVSAQLVTVDSWSTVSSVSRDNTVWYSVISQAAAPPLLTFMALDAGCLQLQPRIMGDMCGHVEQPGHHLSSHTSYIKSSHQNIKSCFCQNLIRYLPSTTFNNALHLFSVFHSMQHCNCSHVQGAEYQFYDSYLISISETMKVYVRFSPSATWTCSFMPTPLRTVIFQSFRQFSKIILPSERAGSVYSPLDDIIQQDWLLTLL